MIGFEYQTLIRKVILMKILETFAIELHLKENNVLFILFLEDESICNK